MMRYPVNYRIVRLGWPCALLALLAMLLPAPARSSPALEPAPAGLNSELMGMVIRDPWYDFGTNPYYPNEPNYAFQERMGANLAQMGVRWVRLEFHIEGGAASAAAEVARNDYFINVVAPRYNLKVLGLLSFGLIREIDPRDPERGLISTATYDDPVYGGGVNDYMRTWLDRARMIANRYQGAVAAYEILNEQNRLPPNGDGIPADVAARLHTKFYRFFRHVDRENAPVGTSWRDSVQIILGGLHPAGSGPTGQPTDRQYLQQIYASDGFTSYKQTYDRFPIDGLGYHPYPEEIRVSLNSAVGLIGSRMQQVREVLIAVGDPQLPFWVTEVGYNIAFRGQTEEGQASFLIAIYRELAARGDVANIFWFKYEDFPPASGPNAQKWGVVQIPFIEGPCPGGFCYELSGQPSRYRHAFWAYRTLAGLPMERVYLPLLRR